MRSSKSALCTSSAMSSKTSFGAVLLTVLTSVCVVAGGGCEPDATPANFDNQTLDTGGTGADTEPSVDASVSTGMSGRWLLASDWSTCVTLGGSPVELRTRKLLLVDMVHKGHSIDEIRQVCSVETTPLIGLKTLVPKAVAQGVGKLPIQATILGDGVGAAYSSDAEVQLWGAKLVDPLADPMPKTPDPNDKTLVDTDADGNPGATLRIDGICDIYVTQRAVAIVVGTLDEKGRIVGQGLHTTEQHVLKATKPICAQKYTTDPNDAHNNFAMTPAKNVPSLDKNNDKTIDCDELIAGQADIAKWIEPDNKRCAAK